MLDRRHKRYFWYLLINTKKNCWAPSISILLNVFSSTALAKLLCIFQGAQLPVLYLNTMVRSANTWLLLLTLLFSMQAWTHCRNIIWQLTYWKLSENRERTVARWIADEKSRPSGPVILISWWYGLHFSDDTSIHTALWADSVSVWICGSLWLCGAWISFPQIQAGLFAGALTMPSSRQSSCLSARGSQSVERLGPEGAVRLGRRFFAQRFQLGMPLWEEHKSQSYSFVRTLPILPQWPRWGLEPQTRYCPCFTQQGRRGIWQRDFL